MRTLLTLALCAIAIGAISCNNTPTSVTTGNIGPTTIDAMMANSGYRAWYDPGYSAYPEASGKAVFDSAVAAIRSSFDSTQHKVVMAIKPNCGCQTTQLWLPRVMKVLDAAGVPHNNLEIYITDARLTGLDSVRTKYNAIINVAPMFLIVKKTTVETSIDPVLIPSTQSIEQVMAGGFAKP